MCVVAVYCSAGNELERGELARRVPLACQSRVGSTFFRGEIVSNKPGNKKNVVNVPDTDFEDSAAERVCKVSFCSDCSEFGRG